MVRHESIRSTPTISSLSPPPLSSLLIAYALTRTHGRSAALSLDPPPPSIIPLSLFLFFFSDRISAPPPSSLSPSIGRLARSASLSFLVARSPRGPIFSFHRSLLIAKCRNILLPELFSSRSPNQLSRGGIARGCSLQALSRGPCRSNWISRLARRSSPIPPIFPLRLCLFSPGPPSPSLPTPPSVRPSFVGTKRSTRSAGLQLPQLPESDGKY